MSYYEEDEFVTEWDVFAADEEEEEDELTQECDFSQDSFSVGTDGSPVDVMGFPMTAENTTSSKRRSTTSSKLERRIGQDEDVSSTHQQRQRRNVSRLPRKARSLDDSGKSSVLAAAAATQSNPRRSMSGEPSRGGRRRSSTSGSESVASNEERQTRRGPRGSMRRSVNTDGKSLRRSVTGEGPRRSTRNSLPPRSDSGGSESAADRAQRLKDLALAYQAATALGKGMAAKTEHLKKEVLM